MEASKKKTIMITIVVACLALAGAVTFSMRGTQKAGLEGVKAGEEMWLVKCSNPDCEVDYQIDKREYLETLAKRREELSMGMGSPPLICQECGKDSVYKALKCEKCNVTFFTGSVRRDFKDRCPECGYSKIEEVRKK